MNQKEKLILTTLQSKFPLSKHPYRDLARRLKINEKFLLSKVSQFKRKGIIRRIGAIVSSERLGHKGVLIGISVPQDKLKGIVSFINSSSCVSHNYLRDCEYNVWFTFSAKKKKELTDFVRDLRKNKNIRKILILPAKKLFKLNAEFRF